MWIILLLVYGAFLAIATYFIAIRGTEPDPGFFAAEPLAFNHLIVEKDLQDVPSPTPKKVAAPPPKRKSAPEANEAPSTSANAAPAPDAKTTPPPPAKKSSERALAIEEEEQAQPVAPALQDAKKVKFVGKYTLGTVGQRQLLREWELAPTPSLSPPDAALRALLPVSADDIISGKINAGSWLCVGRLN